MTTNAPPADGGILSVEQAIADLDKSDKEQAAPEAAAAEETPAADPAAEHEPEAESTPAEEGSEAEAPGDAEEAEQPEAEAEAIKLDAPKWWNAAQKQLWETLDPAVKAAVYAQEENRERVLQRDRQKLSEAEKVANEGKASLAKRLSVLDRVLPTAINAFKGKWADVDWVEASKSLSPQDYQQARAEFEAESRDMADLLDQQKVAEAEQLANFVREEGEKLATECPDLVDATHGKQRKQALGTFLLNLKIPPERILRLSAIEASMAYDAMRWRDAQKKASQAKKPANPPQPANKPSPAAGSHKPRSSRLVELQRMPTRTVEETLELMALEGGA